MPKFHYFLAYSMRTTGGRAGRLVYAPLTIRRAAVSAVQPSRAVLATAQHAPRAKFCIAAHSHWQDEPAVREMPAAESYETVGNLEDYPAFRRGEVALSAKVIKDSGTRVEE